MPLEITVEMDYQLEACEAVLLQLEVAETEGQRVLETALEVEGAGLTRIAGEYGVGARVWAALATDRLSLRYRALVEVERQDVALVELAAMPIETLPPEALSALRPSRFCPSDLFSNFTGQQFGHLEGGAKVAAILNFVQSETEYVSGSSDVTTTAVETFHARQGVCRDFAHLLCTLVRAANIPARYVSVYGVGVQPPDFHAAAQVWLEGGWRLVDATGMAAATGLVVIGAGRDAADVAFMETSQPAQLIAQRVSVQRV
jgi:transglutaminase-like putative cysteine protease